MLRREYFYVHLTSEQSPQSTEQIQGQFTISTKQDMYKVYLSSWINLLSRPLLLTLRPPTLPTPTPVPEVVVAAPVD